MLTTAVKSKKNSLSSHREFLRVKLPKLKKRCPIVISLVGTPKRPKKSASKEPKSVKTGDQGEKNLDEKEEKKINTQIEKDDEHSYQSGDIRCACGINQDIGTFVECESCLTWQHLHCINVGREEDVPNNYKCAFCLYPKIMVRKTLKQPISWYQFLNPEIYNLQTQKSLEEKTSDSNCDSAVSTKIDQLEGDQLNDCISTNGNNNNNSDNHDNSISQKQDDYATVLNKPVHNISEISNEAKEIQRVIHSIQAKVSLLTVERKDPELKLWQYSWLNDKINNNVELASTDWKKCRQNLKEHVYYIYNLVEYRLRILEQCLELIENNQQHEQHLNVEGLHILPALKSTLRSLIVTMTNVKNSIMQTSKDS